MANIDRAFTVDGGLSIDDVVGIFQSSNNPIVSGEAAPIGSLLLSTTGQLYRKTGAADTNWVQVSNTGNLVISTYRRSGAAIQNITTTFAAILFDISDFTLSDFTYAGGVFTTNVAGVYKVTSNCSAVAAGNQRTASEWQLFVNNAPVVGSTSYAFHVNNSEGFDTASLFARVSLNIGDTIEVRGRGTAQPIVTVSNVSRVLIEKVL